MPAKFTSDTKGRVINGIETSPEEAMRLMGDESKTFYMCPGIAPLGFVDLCAGVTVFPAIGTDGHATGAVYLYEVLDEDDTRAVSFRAAEKADADLSNAVFTVTRNSGGSYGISADGESVAFGCSRDAVIDLLTPRCGEQSVTAMLNEADNKAGSE